MPRSGGTNMTRRVWPLIVITLLALAGSPSIAPAQDPDKGVPIKPGPSQRSSEAGQARTTTRIGRLLVGDAAPDIDLRDHDGDRFQLSKARREKPWILVFARFPEDVTEVELAESAFRTLGIGVVIVAPFGGQKVEAVLPGHKVRLLTDRASRTAQIYGLFDVVTRNPRPGAFLVDRDGRIVLIVSGGIPAGAELVRMSKEAMEVARGES